MLDKFPQTLEPSMVSRTSSTMFNGQSNLSNLAYQEGVGGYPKTGSGLRREDVFHSNNNDCMQQQSFNDSADDEFSDFQSAPLPISTGTVGNGFPMAQVPPFGFSTQFQPPRAVNPTIALSVNQPIQRPSPASATVGRGRIKESVVGCRLANYDLGFSPQHRNQQPPPPVFPIQPETLKVVPSSTASTTSSSVHADGLLIGEEDKYSALRGLVLEDAVSEPSIFDSLGAADTSCSTPKSVCNVEHKISLVSDDVIEVVRTETTDSADFGDFQSFGADSGSAYPSKPPPAHNTLVGDFSDVGVATNNVNRNENFSFNNFGTPISQNVDASVQQNQKDDLRNLKFAFDSPASGGITPSVVPTSPDISGSLQFVPPLSSAPSNAASLSDGEYGDFVGFSDQVPSTSKPIAPPVPVTPKIVLKTDVPKKHAAGKPKKSHSSGKPTANRIAKASCILTESPTLPKTEEKKMEFLDPMSSLPYEPSGVLQSSFSTDLDDLFDIKLSVTPNPATSQDKSDLSILQELESEFGAHVKTSFPPCTAIDTDEFGDFATVPQLSSDSSLKANNLDSLALSKRKAHSPVETQSLASLDLGIYVESGDSKTTGESGASPEGSNNLEFDPYMKDDATEMLSSDSPRSDVGRNTNNFQLPDEGTPVHHSVHSTDDKYSCFKEEMENERERCTSEWARCLTCCLRLITQAHSILNSASSSEVVREIVSNEKGHSYVLNLIEVYGVSRRIHQSWLKMGGGIKVRQLYDEIVSIWESLATFFLGTPLMETVANLKDSEGNDCRDALKVCGVCLVGSNDNSMEGLLDYGGKCYHATCANLWINQVDSILPSLYCISAI